MARIVRRKERHPGRLLDDFLYAHRSLKCWWNGVNNEGILVEQLLEPRHGFRSFFDGLAQVSDVDCRALLVLPVERAQRAAREEKVVHNVRCDGKEREGYGNIDEREHDIKVTDFPRRRHNDAHTMPIVEDALALIVVRGRTRHELILGVWDRRHLVRVTHD